MNFYIVSPNTIFLSGMTLMLEYNLKHNIVAKAINIEDLCNYAGGKKVDVVIVEESFLTEELIARTMANIHCKFGNAKIIALLKAYTDYKVLDYKASGIYRFITYSMGFEELTSRIDALDTDEVDGLVKQALTWNNNTVNFTEKEMRVLQQLCFNRKKSEIALALGMSERTVLYYIERLKKKMRCNNSIGVIIEAVKKGFPTVETKNT